MADVRMPDGRLIRDLTAQEYDATYSDGAPHTIPAEALELAELDAATVGAQDA